MNMVKTILLLLLAGAVLADEPITMSWTPPTKNEDGTDIPPDGQYALDGYRIYKENSVGNYEMIHDEPDPTVVSYTTPPYAPGTYRFVATAYNNAALESRYSGVLEVVVSEEQVPQPPQDLVVQPQDMTAYMMIKVTNRLVLVPVGTVPAGTMCDASQNILDHYVVPYESVVMTDPNQTKSIVMVAKCS